MGVRRETLDTASKSVENASIKRTLLADLGDDWVPTHVSIVDEPAVPKARFFALKSKAKKDAREAEQSTEKSWTQKLKDIVSVQKKEDVKGEGGEEMTNEEMKVMITEAVKSATDPIKEELEKLKVSKSEEEEQGETDVIEGADDTEQTQTAGESTESDDEEDEKSELETFMSQVDEKINAIAEAVGKRTATSRKLTDEEVEKESQSVKSNGRDLYGRKTTK